ncbi:snare-like protein [Xylariaceae sp. FL0594]|nr:snare-like protein [Xylariaceae sp. FL0594]
MPVQVYSLYIFDRHTECIYSKKWYQPPGGIATAPGPDPSQSSDARNPQHQRSINGSSAGDGRAGGVGDGEKAELAKNRPQQQRRTRNKGADDAKLIFGTVFSLRNMVRKLGGEDDAFISYRTAHYKLHYYETPTNLRFAMLTEPGALSMRNVLHQIYINLWVEYVVKNSLAPVEHKGGEGVRNEMFELGLDKFIRGLM